MPRKNLLLTGPPGCGKMECFSRLFIDATGRVLDSPVPVLATVAAKGSGFIREVKGRCDVEVVLVSAANRDRLPDIIVQRLSTG